MKKEVSIWEQFADRFAKRSIYEDIDFIKEKIAFARKFAEDYMAEHPNGDFYCVDFDRPEDAMEIGVYLPLTKEELTIVNGIEDPDELTDEYEKLCDDLVDRVTFPFDDPENPWLVKEISTEPEQLYEFSYAFVPKSGESTIETEPRFVSLSHDEYAVLLSWRLLHLDDLVASFNMLREELPELFDRISRAVEWEDCVIRRVEEPYVVFMDELNEDIEQIKGPYKEASRKWLDERIAKYFKQ